MAERLADYLSNKQNLVFTEEEQALLEKLGYKKNGWWWSKDGEAVDKVELTKVLNENRSKLPASEDEHPFDIWTFQYDAKHKARLPIWDRFPVVVVTGSAPGGFNGVNLHYIDRDVRMRLLQQIFDILDDGGDAEDAIQLITSMEVGYKRYLNSHIRTGKQRIPRRLWKQLFDTTGDFVYK